MSKKIFIDPGHGGIDSGAVAFGLVEKDINLKVAKFLYSELKAYGFDVKMSRETDMFVDLRTIPRLANSWGANLLVSVHHNAAAGKGDGWEIIHSIKKDDPGKIIAELIGEQFMRIDQNKRRIFSKESDNYPGNDYFTVIRYAEMPAIITEFAFLDSEDRFIIDEETEQKKEAIAIAAGIANFFGYRKQDHWAERYYRYLNDKGIVIHDRRFDEPATRGDVMALLARIQGYKEG